MNQYDVPPADSYRWTPTAEEQEEDRAVFGDLGEEYAVELDPTVPGGCVIWPKYHGEWHVNPWSARPLVRHLLEEQIRLTEEVEELKRARDEAIEVILRSGHTPHCACRQAWGDGECECSGKVP